MYNGFKLIESETKKEDIIRVVVVGDVGDGDYEERTTIESIDSLESEEFMKSLKAIHDLASNRHIDNYNFENRTEVWEALGYTEEEISYVNDIMIDIITIPSGEYDFIHTVLSVNVEVVKDNKTYSIDFN